MKSNELQATPDNAYNQFLKDSIGRNIDVLGFCSFLINLEGSYSILLDGKWGSGKSFFVQQTKLVLDSFNDHVCTPDEETANSIKQKVGENKKDKDIEKFLSNPQVTVYYDAWENDNDQDPILSILYSVTTSADNNFIIENERKILDTFGCIADMITGTKISDLLNKIKGSDVLKNIKNNKSIIELMNNFFDTLILEHGQRLVIFIDELDRCKPSFAVRLLERIKHYFIDERVTFVFSINVEQLQHTIKNFYGAGFASSLYLDRFFDLRFSLQKPNYEKFYKSISFPCDYQFDKVCRYVIQYFGFEMREAIKFINTAKVAAYKPTHTEQYNFYGSIGKTKSYLLNYILPYMIGLKYFDNTQYTEFISGKNPLPLIEFVKNRSEYKDMLITELLNNNETCWNDNIDSTRHYITPDIKIQELYNALFIQDYNDDISMLHVGDLTFNQDCRNTILRATSLLSEYADYDS